LAVMRCFVAVDIDERIAAALGRLEEKLRSRMTSGKAPVRWVRPESIHLTVKFLGEVTQERIRQACEIVASAAPHHERFDLFLESVGYFGRGYAKVLWVGAGRGSEQLRALQADMEKRFAKAGWPREKRAFSAHLTLCRVKNRQAGLELAELSKEYEDFELGVLSVDSISVYQSRLKPTGAEYRVLAKYKLQ